VRTDPTHLRQILINLIGNAVKYTPSGSVSVRARLLGAPEELGPHTPTPRAGMDDPSAAALLAKAPRSGIWVALQVIDTGVGIAANDLARIFDEFEQVNAGPRGDSMQRGTGLGLAISRRLARLLWRANVRSRVRCRRCRRRDAVGDHRRKIDFIFEKSPLDSAVSPCLSAVSSSLANVTESW
jgi:light-regulated signal transduction histidine kinase (bacteriophytochrome)